MNITTKALIGTGIVVVLLLGLSLFFRHELQLALMTRLIHPSHAFSDAPSPPQPDYSNPDHWAALFDREDLADVVPKDTTDLQGVASADVFFIHPTTYFSRSTWNQSLDDGVINRFTDTMVIQGQASAYNACCRVYAPRYRQATLAAFFTDDDSGRSSGTGARLPRHRYSV